MREFWGYSVTGPVSSYPQALCFSAQCFTHSSSPMRTSIINHWSHIGWDMKKPSEPNFLLLAIAGIAVAIVLYSALA